jgi:hypothetical protein
MTNVHAGVYFITLFSALTDAVLLTLEGFVFRTLTTEGDWIILVASGTIV